MDICHIISQLTWLWSHVKVRDVALRVELTEKLIQCIVKVAEYYVDKVMTQLSADGFNAQMSVQIPQPLINVVCFFKFILF